MRAYIDENIGRAFTNERVKNYQSSDYQTSPFFHFSIISLFLPECGQLFGNGTTYVIDVHSCSMTLLNFSFFSPFGHLLIFTCGVEWEHFTFAARNPLVLHITVSPAELYDKEFRI